MKAQEPCVGIFHISDLHFSAKGQPERVDSKTGGKNLEGEIGGDAGEIFLHEIPSLLRERESEGRPVPAAIIVNGDLIAKQRKMTPLDADNAFEHARDFLVKLAQSLYISDLKKVYVVPGNHDVDWTASMDTVERFARYVKWMQPFSTPGFDQGEPDPLLVELSTLHPEVEGQLLFLVSPTFGGLPALEAATLKDRLEELLKEKLTLDQIGSVVESVTRSLDIAAIGASQRRRMIDRIDESLGRECNVLSVNSIPIPLRGAKASGASRSATEWNGDASRMVVAGQTSSSVAATKPKTERK